MEKSFVETFLYFFNFLKKICLIFSVRYHIATGSEKFWQYPSCFPATSLVHAWIGFKPRRNSECISHFSPDSYPYVSSLVCAFFMCLTPLWIVISSKHPASRTLLYSGWEPVITAMVISRCVCMSVYVTVCVFSLQRGKNSYSASATASVWFAWWLIPLNKLQNPSTYTLRSPWAWQPY